MRLMVTGGAGFIGSNLVDRLVLDRIGEVVVFDDFSRGRKENLSQSERNIRIVHGDIRNRASLERAMTRVDVVFHLAAKSRVLDGTQDPDGVFQTNVIGTYEVLRVAALSGVKRVIFTSSREVYGDATSIPVEESAPLLPKDAYGVSKAAAELYCKLFCRDNMDVIIFRLSNVYGLRDCDRVIPLFVKQALSGERLTVFGSGKILDFLWIEDLIDVLIQAATRPCPNSPLNIASGKGVKLVDLAERICAIAESASSIRIGENRKSEVQAFIADVSAARKLFNLRCPEDPIEHLQELIQAWRFEKGPFQA
jgi:UDP-glucose 4-epimerase